jgi:transcriptional regulator with XRE-family HTH domain
VADLIGVDRNTYAGWETETTDVKAEFIPALAEVYDVSIPELFLPDLKVPRVAYLKDVVIRQKDLTVLDVPLTTSVNELPGALVLKTAPMARRAATAVNLSIGRALKHYRFLCTIIYYT